MLIKDEPALRGENLKFALRELRGRMVQLRENAVILHRVARSGGTPLITPDAARGVADDQLERAKRLDDLLFLFDEIDAEPGS